MEQILQTLDRAEILRYLGYRGHEPDEKTALLIDEVSHQILEAASARFVYRYFDLQTLEDGTLMAGGVVLMGEDIRRHLAGSRRCVFLCATLGPQVDTVIRYLENVDLAKALIADCCATTAIEQVCDALEEEIRAQCARRGKYITWRYSAGYGDLPISIQKDFVTALDGQKRAGVHVSSSGILIPRKSVTAIIGVRDEPVAEQKRGCESCANREHCIMRKEGRFCGNQR